MKFRNVRKIKDLNSDIPSDGEQFAEYLDSMREILRGHIPQWATKRECIEFWKREFSNFLRLCRVKEENKNG